MSGIEEMERKSRMFSLAAVLIGVMSSLNKIKKSEQLNKMDKKRIADLKKILEDTLRGFYPDRYELFIFAERIQHFGYKGTIASCIEYLSDMETLRTNHFVIDNMVIFFKELESHIGVILQERCNI